MESAGEGEGGVFAFTIPAGAAPERPGRVRADAESRLEQADA